MLKPKSLILIALLLALLLWSGAAMAGPKRPHWGDPDIVEGMRQQGGATPIQFSDPSGRSLVIDIPILGRIIFRWQEQRVQLDRKAERLPAATKRALVSR
jgi:hypothetical protein